MKIILLISLIKIGIFNLKSLIFNKNNIAKRLRINEGIRVPKVLLVDGDDTSEVAIEDALKRAKEKGLDLVEVSPLSSPPVCKIMDYGTHLYSQKKKDRKQKKSQKQTETKT
ncbi:translation initiation factor IF-3, partial [Patescibacteria group bacterium]|nr:translation initiation factor IF-3 [Patescibacteria group bacterium]